MLPSLSLEQTATERWRRIVISRYIALAIIAVGAALIPALRDHRWYLVAYVVLVGFPYNRLVQRLVAERGSPGRWVVITDTVLVVMTVPVSTATTLPVCLVVVAVVALGTITVGRREPAIATVVGTVLLSIINLTVGLPWGWLAPVALAITCTMIVINVGEVIDSEREVRSKLVALIDGLDGMIWSRCPTTFEYDFVSSQAEALLGWPRDQWLETGFWARHAHPDDAVRIRAETQEATKGLDDHELRYRFQAADGRWVHLHELVTVMPTSTARPLFTQGITLDVTDAAVTEQELRRLALHDGLTGLPNRSYLEDRLRVALPRLAATDARAALLVMDLDQFKEVNDALGHHVGDRLLVALADRLRRLDHGALVARLGGDEFAVLVEDIAGIDEATALAEEIHALLDPALRPGRRPSADQRQHRARRCTPTTPPTPPR